MSDVKALRRKYKALPSEGDAHRNTQAERDRLYHENDRLAYAFLLRVGRGWVKPSSNDYDDALQNVRMGLLEAAFRYDVSKGIAFSTYAEYWMKHYLQEWMRMRGVVTKPRESVTGVSLSPV